MTDAVNPSLALAVEQGLPVGATNMECSRAFQEAADNREVSDPAKTLFEWEALLHEYRLDYSEEFSHEIDALQPMFTRGDFNRPPRVKDFDCDAITYFRQRIDEAHYPTVRARLADFLWIRTREVVFADTAIAAYLAAIGDMTAHPTHSCQYACRAARLTRMLGRDTVPVSTTIRIVAETFLVDRGGYVCQLVLRVAKDIASDEGLAVWLTDELLARAAVLAAEKGEARDSERAFLEAAKAVTRERRDTEGVRSLDRRIALSFEQEAEDRSAEGGLIQSTMLQRAVTTYARAGSGDDIRRLKVKLHEATRAAERELKPIVSRFEIPIEKLREHADQVMALGKRRTPWLHMIIFGLNSGLWPTWSELEKRVEDLRRRFPIQYLVSKTVIGPDGRPLPQPADPAKAKEFDEIQQYVQDVQLHLGVLRSYVEIFRERDGWNENLVLSALNEGSLFTDAVWAAVAPGIRAYEEGRHWDAIHVLLPQIERVIRVLAQGTGAETYRYVVGTGEIHWTSLKSLLSEPSVREVLGRYRPDLSRELGYLLVDSRGWNLRDDMAHGILTTEAELPSISLLSVLMLLSLAAVRFAPLRATTLANNQPDVGQCSRVTAR